MHTQPYSGFCDPPNPQPTPHVVPSHFPLSVFHAHIDEVKQGKQTPHAGTSAWIPFLSSCNFALVLECTYSALEMIQKMSGEDLKPESSEKSLSPRLVSLSSTPCCTLCDSCCHSEELRASERSSLSQGTSFSILILRSTISVLASLASSPQPADHL